MRYPPATVNSKRNARLRSVCPDQVPWSMRVKRSWETLSNASAMAEHVVILVKYSNAMRYIQSGSGIESFLPKEILCLFLCGFPLLRNFCSKYYTDFGAFTHAIEDCLMHTQTIHKQALCSLLTLNFQSFRKAQSLTT